MTGTMRRGTKSHRFLLQTGEGMQRGGGFCLMIFGRLKEARILPQTAGNTQFYSPPPSKSIMATR